MHQKGLFFTTVLLLLAHTTQGARVVYSSRGKLGAIRAFSRHVEVFSQSLVGKVKNRDEIRVSPLKKPPFPSKFQLSASGVSVAASSAAASAGALGAWNHKLPPLVRNFIVAILGFLSRFWQSIVAMKKKVEGDYSRGGSVVQLSRPSPATSGAPNVLSKYEADIRRGRIYAEEKLKEIEQALVRLTATADKPKLRQQLPTASTASIVASPAQAVSPVATTAPSEAIVAVTSPALAATLAPASAERRTYWPSAVAHAKLRAAAHAQLHPAGDGMEAQTLLQATAAASTPVTSSSPSSSSSSSSSSTIAEATGARSATASMGLPLSFFVGKWVLTEQRYTSSVNMNDEIEILPTLVRSSVQGSKGLEWEVRGDEIEVRILRGVSNTEWVRNRDSSAPKVQINKPPPPPYDQAPTAIIYRGKVLGTRVVGSVYARSPTEKVRGDKSDVDLKSVGYFSMSREGEEGVFVMPPPL